MTAAKAVAIHDGPRFNASTRADCCPAQARVEVLAGHHRLPLLLCAHHFRKHERALLASGARVTHDERAALLARVTDV